jgi:hypothetical protein
VATGSENGKAANSDEEPHGPRECMPCRGTGQVTSNLGGTPKQVTCPWCEGAGTRVTGLDAQAHWPAGEPHTQHGAAGPETQPLGTEPAENEPAETEPSAS